jgi:hypothetical protein
VFNGPSLDLSCERREASVVPTQAFSLFNGEFVHDMALAMAARLARENRDPRVQVSKAFELAYNRKPEPEELRLALRHIEKQTRHHERHPPAPRPENKPIVHTITSELTGEKSQFTQMEPPGVREENLHPGETPPGARALADFVLVLFNSNEFVYVY